MQHTVAIGADDREIRQFRHPLAVGARKNLAVVYFAKPLAQPPIARHKVKIANLTCKPPLNEEHGPFLLFYQSPIPLKPEVRDKASSALSSRRVEQVQVLGHRFRVIVRAEIRPDALSY